MRVLVFGSKTYKDYNELIRQVTVLIDDRRHFYPDDKDYTFIHTGLAGAENMITEYIGKVEKFMRQKGFKVKEELVRDKSTYSDVSLIESMPDFVLIFGESSRNRQCIRVLEAMEVPYRYIKD
jgi:hypothetical protein